MKTIELNYGKVALCDEEDYDYLMQFGGKWHAVKDHNIWYARVALKRKNYLMHRLVMQRAGFDIKGKMIDHISNENENSGLDNRKSNLRLATNQLNQINAQKRKNKIISQYAGVGLSGSGWKAEFKVNGEGRYFGTFDTERLAAICVDMEREKLYGSQITMNVSDATEEEKAEIVAIIANPKKRKNTHSRFFGVTKFQNRWQVYVSASGKDVYCGRYSTEEEAALVYNQRAKEILGEKAKTNIL